MKWWCEYCSSFFFSGFNDECPNCKTKIDGSNKSWMYMPLDELVPMFEQRIKALEVRMMDKDPKDFLENITAKFEERLCKAETILSSFSKSGGDYRIKFRRYEDLPVMNRSCSNCGYFMATQHGYGLCVYPMPPWADEDNYVRGDLSGQDWGANGCKCYSVKENK